MKITSVLTLLLLTAACTSNAQNAAPVVDRVAVSIEGGDEVVIEYDVSDAEGDRLDVSIALSSDTGRSFTRVAGGLSGDVGEVSPGASRRIAWSPSAEERARLSGVVLRVRVVADDGMPVDIRSHVDRVDSALMRGDLESIVGPRNRRSNPSHLESVRSIIASMFDVHDFPSSSHGFTFLGDDGRNIIGERNGLVAGDTVVILDAHYDTVSDAPGADDNGSGVAGLFAAVRALEGLQFRRTVRVIGFDFEEDGLIGSRAYVDGLRAAGTPVAGVLNFEMIGYASDEPNSQRIPPGFELLFPEAIDSINADQRRGNFIIAVSNPSSTALSAAFVSAARRYVPQLRVIPLMAPGNGQFTSDLRRSDHAPFWDAEYPAMMLTDGANFRNPNYHTSGDSIGTLDFTFMQRVVRASVATLIELAGPMHAGAMESGEFTLGPATAVRDENRRSAARLLQAIPNPLTTTSRIRFVLPRAGRATLELFDVMGRRVARLVDGERAAGEHASTIDAARLALPSGMYLCRLLFDGASMQRTLIVD